MSDWPTNDGDAFVRGLSAWLMCFESSKPDTLFSYHHPIFGALQMFPTLLILTGCITVEPPENPMAIDNDGDGYSEFDGASTPL